MSYARFAFALFERPGLWFFGMRMWQHVSNVDQRLKESEYVPLGIDEFGGCETVTKDGVPFGNDKDGMLKRMLASIVGLKDQGIRFSYATVFLESKWGDAAKLA